MVHLRSFGGLWKSYRRCRSVLLDFKFLVTVASLTGLVRVSSRMILFPAEFFHIFFLSRHIFKVVLAVLDPVFTYALTNESMYYFDEDDLYLVFLMHSAVT